MKNIFIFPLIFFLTCITEICQAYFWVAVFALAASWPDVWMVIKFSQSMGFNALFACVASLFVPLFMAVIFGVVVMGLRKKAT